jgi:transposase
MLTDERTTVGLDVHAWSVVAEAVDWSSGQVFSDRLVPANEMVLAWVARLLGPVAVTYEAGPSGFGLARAFAAVGIRCEVVAPSKLERPPGDRVKTDRRDARRLARLLHIGEITGIRVPTLAEEDARDLVRAREAVRGDLMRARHRLSKLLLRHGIVYCGGKTWNGVHERWLRGLRFDYLPCTRVALEEAFDAVLSTAARRDRLDEAIEAMAAWPQWAPIVSRLGAIRGVASTRHIVPGQSASAFSRPESGQPFIGASGFRSPSRSPRRGPTFPRRLEAASACRADLSTPGLTQRSRCRCPGRPSLGRRPGCPDVAESGTAALSARPAAAARLPLGGMPTASPGPTGR